MVLLFTSGFGNGFRVYAEGNDPDAGITEAPEEILQEDEPREEPVQEEEITLPEEMTGEESASEPEDEEPVLEEETVLPEETAAEEPAQEPEDTEITEETEEPETAEISEEIQPAEETETAEVPEEDGSEEELPAEEGEEPAVEQAMPINTGNAYGVLSAEGDLILFRSTEAYEAGTGKTVSIDGTEYTGTVFTNIEALYTAGTSPFAGNTDIRTVSIAAGHEIQPKVYSGYFRNCTELVSVDLTGFDTGYGNTMVQMFAGCTKLETADLSGINKTYNIAHVSQLFAGCESLKTVRLMQNASNIIQYNEMFTGCTSLETLDLSMLNTAKATNMTGMFSGCTSLNEIILGPQMSVWQTSARLPDGAWKNEAISVSLPSEEFVAQYPEHCTEWAGTWVRDTYGTAYAVLESDGDLIFTRSFYTYANEQEGTLVSRSGASYTGTIFTDIEDALIQPPWYNRKPDIVTVQAEDTVRPLTMDSWFAGCSNLTSFDAQNFVTSSVTSMHYLFDGCSSLVNIDHLDQFNTSNVTDMSGMFYYCSKLTSLDLSSFQTSSMTGSMRYMFRGCEKITSLDLSSFDTSNVTEMANMFEECRSLETLILGSGFTAESVSGSLEAMFSGCESLKTLDLSTFNTQNVTSMYFMFNRCKALETLTFGPAFSTANVTNMNSMFYDCESLKNLDVSGFNTQNVTTMYNMFAICEALETLTFGPGFNTSNVTDMGAMFTGCKALTSLDVSGFDTSKVTFFAGMFRECYALLSLDLRNWNTSSAENMSQMFYLCESLQTIQLDESFDTSNVKYMDCLFGFCKSLTSLDLSHFNTSKVTGMSDMFNDCYMLEELDVSSFDTSNVTSMSAMFSNMTSVKHLDVSNFDTSKVTAMDWMFYNMPKLESITFGENFKTSSVSTMSYLFTNDASLQALDLSTFNTANVTNMAGMFDGLNALTSLTLGKGFTVWHSGAPLQEGIWVNKARGLTKTSGELQAGYPANAGKWYGTWVREDRAFAVLQDDGDLIFTRSREYHPNAARGTLTDLKGNTYTGWIYSDVEDTGMSVPSWANNISVRRAYAVDTIRPLSMANWFYNCTQLQYFDSTNFDTSACTNMHYLFFRCESLEAPDLSHFDTSKVTNMYGMFAENRSLRSLDLHTFNTTKVTNMSWMFHLDDKLESLDLSSFDTSSVTDMYSMFGACYALSSVKLGTKWTVWRDGDSYGRLPDGSWSNLAKNITMSAEELYMQYPVNAKTWAGEWCRVHSYGILQDDGQLILTNSKYVYGNDTIDTLTDLKGNTYTGRIFANIENTSDTPWYSYKSQILSVRAADTVRPGNMTSWFYECNNLKTFDGHNIDTSACTSFYLLFADCYALEYADLSTFDTANVTDMSYMFIDCHVLPAIDLSTFNTEKVTDMSYMFKGCYALETLDLSSFHTPLLNSTYYMFYNCTSLKTLDLSRFNTANVSSMYNTFKYCDALESLYLSPEWIRWSSDSGLRAGTWTNGALYVSELDLQSWYPDNAQEWKGLWTWTDKTYGDVDPLDTGDIREGLWIGHLDDYDYTGKAITQDVRVYHGMVRLTQGRDYTVKYKNNKNAGTATVTVTGKGNYQGSQSKTFEIIPWDIDATNTVITLNKDTFLYNGKVQKPKVTSVVYTKPDGNKVKLKANQDYTVEYSAGSADIGSYSVTVKGKGNYDKNDALTLWYEITNITPVNSLSIKLSRTKYAYDGTAKYPDPVYGAGVDPSKLTVAYEDNTDAGTAKVTFTGDGITYAGSVTKTFEITGTPISKAKILYFEKTWPYLGYPIIQGITLEYADVPLDGSSYSIEYLNNTEIGTATMIITGQKGFTGTVKKTFRIFGTQFKEDLFEISGFMPAVDYTGSEIRQDGTVLHDKIIGHDLAEGTHYTVSYKNNVKAGTATVTYTGMHSAGFEGSFSKTFRINKPLITASDISLNSIYFYTKGGVKPVPVVTVNGRKLINGTDFTLSYKNNNKLGTAGLTVKGKGNYTGTVSADFTVIQAGTGGLTMTAADKPYSAKAAVMKTAVTIRDRNGAALAAKTDYDPVIRYTYVDYTTLADGTVRNPGEAVQKSDIIPAETLIKAEADLKGKYTGTVSAYFRIVETSIASAKVTVPVQYYSGMPVIVYKEDITVKVGSMVLAPDQFEIVSYANNTKKGTATVTIRGIGNFGGTKTVKFKIVQRSFGGAVRFYGSDATSGTMKDQLIYKDTRLRKNTYTKTGYTFKGWAVYPGGPVEYANLDVFTYNRDTMAGRLIRLYAVWE